jgi:ABC-type antimicrobial peptide transport system permease subunit
METREITVAGPRRPLEQAVYLITRRYPVFPTWVIASFVFLALFGSFFAPFDPIKQDLSMRLAPPAWMEGGQRNISWVLMSWAVTS